MHIIIEIAILKKLLIKRPNIFKIGFIFQNMVATLQQIIGKVNPILYADNGKELLMKYGSIEKIPAEEVKPKPLAEHKLVYDSSSETLEPIYFFILDLMNDYGLAPKKYIDNFSSSTGSGHFGELGQRASIMQQQATKLMGDINTVLRSILNLIYDLKEFRIRLQSYEDLKNPDKKESATLSLKQIWMDKVDINKGQSSIKAMALGQAGFTTLIDAFLAAKDEKDVDKIDLNERVKRIIKPRIHEFNIWIKQSGDELRKRYELEKTYLKSQVNSLKLYTRWAKPYLRAAQDLEARDMGREAALVKTFNTIILELSLLGKQTLKIKESALEGSLPREFEKIKTKRGYHSCILVDFRFRGIPQRVAQQSHYAFGGRAEISFIAYSLNDDELKMIDKEMEDSDVGNALKLIEGATTESIAQLQSEIDFFLEETSQKEESSKRNDTSNPFLALIGGYNEKPSAPKNKDSKKEIIYVPDNWMEKVHIRPLASDKAVETTFSLFDVYKKAHGMASFT